MSSSHPELVLPGDAPVTAEPEALPARYLRLNPATVAWKRLFDFTLALLGLVLLAPVFALVAVLIKLDSRGPVFFRQDRVGLRRRRFQMWKFRKMRDQMPAQGPSLTRRHDARLTAVGGFLERTKLDELPQLLNVLVGDMSVVGPRPELPKFVEHYSELWDEVLSVKPGVFGPNQLRHRNESELYPPGCPDVEDYYVRQILPKKLAVDAEYARSASLAQDLALVIRCVFASVFGAVTLQTIRNRRWQIANLVILSALGVGGMAAAAQLTGLPLDSDLAVFCLLASLMCKPLCLAAFRIPRALATSLTADDLSRVWWCALTSAALIVSSVLFTQHRDLGRLLILFDTFFFLGILVFYKLVLYKAYVTFSLQEGRYLSRRLIVLAALLGPLSMALVLTARYGSAAWTGPSRTLTVGLTLLAAIVRPAVILIRSVGSGRNSITWMARQWMKVAVGTLVGSCLMIFAALLVNERGFGRFDILCDALVYLTLLTAAALWQNRVLSGPEGHESHPHALNGDARERLLIVGDGIQLTAYISALAALPEHRCEVAGIVTPRARDRAHIVGKYRILGDIRDVPEIVGLFGTSRLVVLTSTLDPATVDHLRDWCRQHRHHLVPVDLLSPLLGK